MKLPSHVIGRRVSPEEVRVVLDHAIQPRTHQEWADYFHVFVDTLRTWRATGLVLGRHAGPTEADWDRLKAEAIGVLGDSLRLLNPRVLLLGI
jgi:hypothetical protein